MIIILALVFTLFIILWNSNSSDKTQKMIQSDYDGKKYKVNNADSAKMKDAAHKLAIISEKVESLKNILRSEHYQNEKVKRILSKYKNNLQEIPKKHSKVAYTKNKGEVIALCLENDDINVLFYVTIHELAHVMTRKRGHPKEFWDNMKFLMKVATENGILMLPQSNSKYCKTTIGDVVKF